MDIGVTIGDKALDTVEVPLLVSLVVSSLEHNRLQVTTCIRLGQVHRHRLARADTGEEALTLILRAKLVKRLGAVL